MDQPTDHYFERGQIRFEGVGVEKNLCLRRVEVRKSRKRRTKKKGETPVIGCASLWRPHGRAQSPLRRPTLRSLGCIQCHCLSAVCGPRNRKSPRHGRKDKPGEAETHRIEEGVAALYRLKPLQISRADEDAQLTILAVSREENLKACVFDGHQAASASSAMIKHALRHGGMTAHNKIPVFAAKVQELTSRSWNSAATTSWNLE